MMIEEYKEDVNNTFRNFVLLSLSRKRQQFENGFKVEKNYIILTYELLKVVEMSKYDDTQAKITYFLGLNIKYRAMLHYLIENDYIHVFIKSKHKKTTYPKSNSNYMLSQKGLKLLELLDNLKSFFQPGDLNSSWDSNIFKIWRKDN